MEQHIKLYCIQDVSDMVGVLIRNGYTCKASVIYKKFPREHDIDCFMVSFYRDKGGEQNERD